MTTPETACPFELCPRCATPGGLWRGGREYRCQACGFRFFQNVAAACGVLIEHQGRFLFLVRAKEPAQGLLGLPGGFVDPHESVEGALAREVDEEIGGTIGPALFVASFPNRYPFAGVDYHTCDLYFRAPLACDPLSLVAEPGEVRALLWLSPAEVTLDRLAFPSLRSFWSRLFPASLPS